MALGAQREHILKLMIRQGVIDTLAGVVIGLMAALLLAVGLTKVMATLLFGVKAIDWLTFLIVSVLLLVVALVASYIPARKATGVDPMIALRNE
jgi:putative ABC transport system permease protein